MQRERHRRVSGLFAFALVLGALPACGGPGKHIRSRAAQRLLAKIQSGKTDAGSQPIPASGGPGADGIRRAGSVSDEALLLRFARSYRPDRSGHLFFAAEPGYHLTDAGVPFNHGSPWDYDAHIPLVFYGPRHVRPVTIRKALSQSYDIPATLSHRLGIDPPAKSTGRAWKEIFLKDEARPRAMLVVVMDQVGYQDMERFRDQMPNLSRFRKQGADFQNTRIHYLPTFTAVSHASIGTGAPPRVHGIMSNMYLKDWTAPFGHPDRGRMNVFFRGSSGEEVDPGMSLAPTLADHLDQKFGNRPEILGQIYAEYAVNAVSGHGASVPGGDRDHVVWHDKVSGEMVTDPRHFQRPTSMKGRSSLDLIQKFGRKYYEFPVGYPGLERRTHWYADWEAESVLGAMQELKIGQDADPDLVLVNLKATDAFGHYYGHDHQGYRRILHSVDQFLGKAEAALQKATGEDGYVIVVTADHGVAPDDSQPIYHGDLIEWLGTKIDLAGDRDGVHPILAAFGYNIYLDLDELAQDGQTLEGVRDLLKADPKIRNAWTRKEVQAAHPRMQAEDAQRMNAPAR